MLKYLPVHCDGHAADRVRDVNGAKAAVFGRRCEGVRVHPPLPDRLVGLVVKASASRAGDPEFESR